MCFTEYDDGCSTTTLRDEWPTARKIHRCDECGGKILPTHKYHRLVHMFDGDLHTLALCEMCEATRQAIHDHEIAEGCAWYEAWAPLGEIKPYLAERKLRYEPETKTLVAA